MSLLEKATCKIEVQIKAGVTEVGLGTGFFINKNQILTANHVVQNCVGTIKILKCHNQNGIVLTAKIIDKCELCDYALLELNEEFSNDHFLELCKSEIIDEEPIRTFGYPNDDQGQMVGELLCGNISRFIDDSSESVHDTILDIKGFAESTKYAAFSGSPVINHYDQVTSILKYQGVRNLSSVSVKKAINFLSKNNIVVKSDQLHSFESYSTTSFIGFEQIQRECEVESQTPLKTLSPQTILESNSGKLFYPNKSKNINEVIQFLRKSKDLNSKLWTGWIQLLTYVEILKGNCKNPNNISIDITSNELFKRLGIINTSRSINMKLYLNFYFTEEESYLNIARKLIHESKNEGLTRNVCNVFNSSTIDFGNISNIKEDISNPVGSGPSIQNYKIGRLSISQLNREVISSNSLIEVSNNLKKIFEDAIK
jgi:hypothetical protein